MWTFIEKCPHLIFSKIRKNHTHFVALSPHLMKNVCKMYTFIKNVDPHLKNKQNKQNEKCDHTFCGTF